MIWRFVNYYQVLCFFHQSLCWCCYCYLDLSSIRSKDIVFHFLVRIVDYWFEILLFNLLHQVCKTFLDAWFFIMNIVFCSPWLWIVIRCFGFNSTSQIFFQGFIEFVGMALDHVVGFIDNTRKWKEEDMGQLISWKNVLANNL